MATSSTITRQLPDEAPVSTRLSATAGKVSDAAATMAGVAGDAAGRLPDLADRVRAAFLDVNRRVQSGTDESLTVGTAVSFGFALGLLIGGASRILVTAAFVPVATMGLTLLDRAARGRLRLEAAGA
jgi:hypothetical protein